MITYNNLIPQKYLIEQEEKITKWLTQVIEIEAKSLGDIIYIFGTDEYINGINKKYLNHDTFTDIITFQESENQEVISGEIFISLDRVVENAKKFCVDIDNEFSRVLVHGVLHLLGYDDKTGEQKNIMRTKENYYINLQPNNFGKMFHVKHS